MFIFGGFRRSWAAATPDCMMTSSNGNIFRVTGPLCGEFTGPGEFPAQRPVTRSFDVFVHPRLYKRLSKQPWGWWFETPAWSLWRHRNGYGRDIHYKINILLIWIRKEKNQKNHGIGGGNLFSNSHIFISHLKTSTDWPIVWLYTVVYRSEKSLLLQWFVLMNGRKSPVLHSRHSQPWLVGTSAGEWGSNTVYPKKYAHGFVVLCFVVVMQSFIMNSHEVFIHIHEGCFAGTGAIVRLPQCQWSKPDGYGKISQCITTTKHNKAKTVCIFLGIYCTPTSLPSSSSPLPLSHNLGPDGAEEEALVCIKIDM